MPDAVRPSIDSQSIRALRPGHGANCSSIGSVVDTLFVTALLGGALFAAVVGALAREPVEVIGPRGDVPDASRDPAPSQSTGETTSSEDVA